MKAELDREELERLKALYSEVQELAKGEELARKRNQLEILVWTHLGALIKGVEEQQDGLDLLMCEGGQLVEAIQIELDMKHDYRLKGRALADATREFLAAYELSYVEGGPDNLVEAEDKVVAALAKFPVAVEARGVERTAEEAAI
jgi:hypothetical protein